VDLFSALLVITFAGFIMLAAAYRQEKNAFQEREEALKQVRHEANDIIEEIKTSLAQDTSMKNIVRACGDDTCIDLYIHFKEGDDVISDPEERKSLETACQILKAALDKLPPSRRNDINLVIEGHTNRHQPSEPLDPRSLYLFNWNLSSRRASSVSYAFEQCGLGPPAYKIQSIGYADSNPICHQLTPQCDDQNRRTTLLLHADTQSIEKRLGVRKP
jgi:flagellar motor protein MotB